MSMSTQLDEDKPSEVRMEIMLPGDEASENLVGVEIGEALEGAELEKVVDADLDRFAKFYRERLGNATLSGYERAAIKTFLWWKTHPEE